MSYSDSEPVAWFTSAYRTATALCSCATCTSTSLSTSWRASGSTVWRDAWLSHPSSWGSAAAARHMSRMVRNKHTHTLSYSFCWIQHTCSATDISLVNALLLSKSLLTELLVQCFHSHLLTFSSFFLSFQATGRSMALACLESISPILIRLGAWTQRNSKTAGVERTGSCLTGSLATSQHNNLSFLGVRKVHSVLR